MRAHTHIFLECLLQARYCAGPWEHSADETEYDSIPQRYQNPWMFKSLSQPAISAGSTSMSSASMESINCGSKFGCWLKAHKWGFTALVSDAQHDDSIFLYIAKWTEIDFKELTHERMEAGKSKICRLDRQAKDPGDLAATVQVPRPSADRCPSCCREVSFLLYSGLQLIGWAHPPYGGRSALLKVYPFKC